MAEKSTWNGSFTHGLNSYSSAAQIHADAVVYRHTPSLSGRSISYDGGPEARAGGSFDGHAAHLKHEREKVGVLPGSDLAVGEISDIFTQ